MEFSHPEIIHAPGTPDDVIIAAERVFEVAQGHADWQAHREPGVELDSYTSPIEGTESPECRMISLSAVKPGESSPEFAVIGAPFLPDGPRIYSVVKDCAVVRQEPYGRIASLQLPPAEQEQRRMVILSRDGAAVFGAAIHRAGFDILAYNAEIASGLSVFDPTVIEDLLPGVLRDRVIAGTILTDGKNENIAGLKAIAEALGAQLTDLEGNARHLAPGETGAIVARDKAEHAALVGAVALSRASSNY